MKFKALLSLILCSAAIFSVSCSGTSDENPPIKNSDKISAEEAVTDEISEFESTIPKKDFNGATYKMLGRNDGDLAELHAVELVTESENGDVINDAVYARNSKISEYLNVTFEAKHIARNETANAVQTTVLAGDNAYDLVWGYISNISPLAVNGYLANFYDFDDISLSSPWWNQPTVKNLTINGKLPLAFSDIAFTSMLYIHCMFVNKTQADELLDENIYDIVNVGEWTLDKLLAVTSDRNSDVNGDSTFDDSDYYGFMTSYGASGIFTTSCNAPILTINDDLSVKLEIMTEKMQSIIDKAYKLTFENGSTYIVENSKERDIASMFSEGHSLFYSGFLSDALLYFRGMEDDYALIPFPKYDSAQDKHLTTISGGNSMLCIPKTVADSDMVGAVTEALAYESYTSIRPAVYETVMVNKLLRDDESAKMFDIIIDGIDINFGWIYHGSNGFGRVLRDLLQNKTTDLSSYYSSRESAAMQQYNETIELYSR